MTTEPTYYSCDCSLDGDDTCDVCGPRARSEWTTSDYFVHALCRTIGCGSFVPWLRGLGYKYVCNPLCLWFFKREEAKAGGAS